MKKEKIIKLAKILTTIMIILNISIVLIGIVIFIWTENDIYAKIATTSFITLAPSIFLYVYLDKEY